ncbi:MAG TPA: NADH-quinone oxidoreductase subunit L [Myxococcota bacterium]|nr:NADH-quinone oxidoreductase subunit L [Myxococcota bacterium]
MSESLVALVPALPLVGAIINGIFGIAGRPLPRVAAGGLASAVMLAAAAISFMTLFGMMGGDHHGAEPIQATLWTWMKTGSVSLDVAFRVDPLTATMMCVVTGIGSLIHLYSIGYMDDDADKNSVWRFFAYLNLFAFAMLCLIMGDNFAMMFVGWEGVGLCSYLLIGFWFRNSEYAAAGKKAFIVNRVGDFLFLAGLFWLFWTLEGQTDANIMNFATLAKVVEEDPALLGGPGSLTITGICLLMFGGATGKSAQIPLYVWLPDAMAGPTPVSALIHAATMVTAGIYMLCRLNFLFILAPAAMAVVATIGVLTAFFAASIAMTQNDIKKVLAYSTVSQLGFMFLGVGVGSFVGGFFHVITHAFFKALMFLGSGSIIHALHHEQDMRKMGGLRKYMPITFATFMCGWVAIIGVPGTSGFFSKDEILWLTFTTELFADLPLGHVMPKVLWALAFTTALMTAFYMSRLVFMTFFGEYRGGHGHHDDHAHHDGHGHGHHDHKPHESPIILTGPLMVLAVLSLVGGAMNLPHWVAEHGWLHHFLGPVFEGSEAKAPFAESALEFPLMGLTLVGVAASVGAAYYLYILNPHKPAEIAERLKLLYVGSLNKWFVDEVYEATLLTPIYLFSRQLLWSVVDAQLIDGAVNGSAAAATTAGEAHGAVGRGKIQVYAISIACGAALFVLAYALS